MRIEDVVTRNLSTPRLQPYVHATGSTPRAIELYRWNLEMSGAIHEALGVVEVTMRNSIDVQLQAWNPTRPAPTGEAPYGPNWVERPARPLVGLLNPQGRKGQRPKSTYQSARERAVKDSNLRDPAHPRHAAVPNHDDIVAHITFGTWVKLLPSKRDAQGQVGPPAQRGLWENALKSSFSHRPNPLVIHYWAQRLHLLRNRIAHVEPLIATDILSYHKTAARLLRAVDPAMGDWYAGISRIPEVYGRKP